MNDNLLKQPQRYVLAGTDIAGGPSVAGILVSGVSGPEGFSKEKKFTSTTSGAEEEKYSIETEIALLGDEVRSMAEILNREGFESESKILDTHVLMLEDEGIKSRLMHRIEEYGESAEEAVVCVFGEMKDRLLESDNALIRERSADVEDLMQRLKSRLSGIEQIRELPVPVRNASLVLVFPELFVSNVVEARNAGVAAIIVESGTGFSHAAIMAKAFGIPVLRVNGIEKLYEAMGAIVVVDVENGRLVIHADEDDISSAALASATATDEAYIDSPLNIWLNLVDTDSHPPESLHGDTIAGIGLFRSESLLTERLSGFPSEEEQYAVYLQLCRRWKRYPVTIRMFDIGGDKTVPYFSLGPQDNPFLGLRAHRLYRFHPELFMNQVRAILRAGIECSDLRILFPMIETVEELKYLQELLASAMEEMKQQGTAYRHDVKQGVLIEVPSAVWILKDLLERLDFISVGTNDLLQYHFAVDRGNINVSNYYQPEHPSALRMLKYIADAASESGKQITLCGEIAADPYLVPVLYGMGFRDLSVDFHAVNSVRLSVPEGSSDGLENIAARCVSASSIEEVHAILDESGGSDRLKPLDHSNRGTGFIDPVCGMVVHRQENLYSFTTDRETYFFCSPECLEQFSRKPERYIR
ncbi:phosphoenolpyruvate--protein phosphotransferase [Marispirochaeta aestuarii]|uniref:phosphoenolpyruvate--protein phosphotransferase n=1 Tax=Marispirochaeta aestuarii TaxID=1963862 RepID=A0A1Y1RWU9_9SPIO|nr:phosphoenolpyruvate--protein phosphotransferase [Marispirochaeta aestuarii]ORC34703.1 phosphoenolpyruvate--protein phosphotransferase [Marispirochaeta aestuarii]